MSDGNGALLPPGWARACIEDLFWPLDDGRTLHQGWSPQCEKTPAPTDEEWGVLKTTSIQAGAFHSEHNKHLPKHLEPRPQIEVKEGDILVTCAGPRVRCGVACLVRATRPRLMMSGKMYRFRVPPQYIDARFLEAYLLTQEATLAIDKMKTGGSDSGLNLTHDRFRPLPVPVAPLGEQQRIMDVLDELLSDLDAGVAALERVRARLKHYRAAVLKAAVEGALTAQWRREHPSTETADALLTRILAERRRRWEEAQLKKFEAAGKVPPKNWKAKYVEPVSPDTGDLPALPEQWRWASLDQACEIRGGLQKQPGRAPKDHHFPYLRVANVHRGFVDLTELKRFELTETELLRHRLETGDLLVVEGNGSKTEIGRCAIWKGGIENCVHQNHIIRVRLIDGIMPAFADQFLNSPTGQRAIQSIASSTSGLYTLSVAKIAKLPLAVPPRSEQAAIVEAVEDQFSVIDHLERDLDARLQSAQSLRQSILRHAFTGKLVPQDPNDEPASELLKRIATEREERAQLAAVAKRKAKPAKAGRARDSRRARTDARE